ncbi:hypothetical protein H0E87_020664, partial [Populus deltoides]
MQDKLAPALASPTLAPSSVGLEGVGQTSRPSFDSSRGITAQNQGKFLNMQDKQAPILASPSRTPCFGLDEVGPDAVQSGHPSGATLSGSGFTSPNLVSVETCSDAEADSSLPSSTSCGHSPDPKPSALVPQPFGVPLSSGVDSPCIPLPIKDASGSALYGEHGRASADPPP